MTFTKTKTGMLLVGGLLLAASSALAAKTVAFTPARQARVFKSLLTKAGPYAQRDYRELVGKRRGFRDQKRLLEAGKQLVIAGEALSTTNKDAGAAMVKAGRLQIALVKKQLQRSTDSARLGTINKIERIGHKLNPEQKALRAFLGKQLRD